MPYVVITGGSRGLGKALVEQYLHADFTVVCCARQSADLQLLRNQIAPSYTQHLHTYTADVADPQQMRSFAAFALEHCPTIDVLINNAGMFVPHSLLSEPDGLLEQSMNTNLYGAYYLTKALLPQLIAQQCGHIFNVCSVASVSILDNCASYTISKHALLGFSRVLRHELKTHHIKVTTVIPGAIYTDSWNGSGIDPQRIMAATDVAQAMLACYRLPPATVVEELVLRPQLGDL